MKKSLIALAAIAATSAFAQSSVTIDGQFDIGLINPIGAQKLHVDGSANGSNQIRFRGTEDLGGGLAANFIAAMRFSPESGNNDGSNNGRPQFQGETTVGLSGGFGSMKIGRALTALQGPINNTDPWGTYQQGSTAVLPGAYSTDPTIADGGGLGRTDGVWYSTPSMGGFGAAVTLSPKTSASSGSVTAPQAKNFYSLWLSYANGPIYVGGGAEQNRVGDKITAILGTYDLGMVKLGAGYAQVDQVSITGVKGKNWNLMAIAPVGAVTIKAAVGQTKAEGTGVKNKQKFGIGADYNLSKRTLIYTSYGHDSKVAAGVSKSGYDIGIRHTF